MADKTEVNTKLLEVITQIDRLAHELEAACDAVGKAPELVDAPSWWPRLSEGLRRAHVLAVLTADITDEVHGSLGEWVRRGMPRE